MIRQGLAAVYARILAFVDRFCLPLAARPCTLHPALCTMHPAPCTLHPAPCTLHPAPCTFNLKPSTPNPQPQTPNPKPQTPNPVPHPPTLITKSKSRPSPRPPFPPQPPPPPRVQNWPRWMVRIGLRWMVQIGPQHRPRSRGSRSSSGRVCSLSSRRWERDRECV